MVKSFNSESMSGSIRFFVNIVSRLMVQKGVDIIPPLLGDKANMVFSLGSGDMPPAIGLLTDFNGGLVMLECGIVLSLEKVDRAQVLEGV
jgi:hypothetical protein